MHKNKDSRYIRCRELAEQAADVMAAGYEDPEERNHSVELLADRLYKEPDPFFFDTIQSLVETLKLAQSERVCERSV